ncbi:MAG: hypothetical protein QOJ27_2659, partial [Sphingomonadales bacterium]|nr:hypothetical protein [Sphingomonadales bacterium]
GGEQGRRDRRRRQMNREMHLHPLRRRSRSLSPERTRAVNGPRPAILHGLPSRCGPGPALYYYEDIDGGHSAAADPAETARRVALEHTYAGRRPAD